MGWRRSLILINIYIFCSITILSLVLIHKAITGFIFQNSFYKIFSLENKFIF